MRNWLVANDIEIFDVRHLLLPMLAACLGLAPSCGRAEDGGAKAQGAAIAVIDFDYVDTSGEERDQRKEHEAPFAAGFDPGLPRIMQPRVLVADINGDGDDDLFLPSTQGACFIERSFLEYGYATSVLLSIESAGR